MRARAQQAGASGESEPVTAQGDPGVAPRQRRGMVVHRRILDVALAHLAVRGYAFSVEEVAAEAGVHKTTVYRRWPGKPELALAAVQHLVDEAGRPPTTGDPLTDLRELAGHLAVVLSGEPGRNALRASLAAAAGEPGLLEATRRFFDQRYAEAAPLIVQAQRAGLLRAGLDPAMLWQAVVNPLHLNAVCGRPTTRRDALALVDLVLTGAQTR